MQRKSAPASSASISPLTFAAKPKVLQASLGATAAVVIDSILQSKGSAKGSGSQTERKGSYKPKGKGSYKGKSKGKGSYKGRGSAMDTEEDAKKADQRARYEQAKAEAPEPVFELDLDENPTKNKVRVAVTIFDGKVRRFRPACVDCCTPPDAVFVRANRCCCHRFLCFACFRGHLKQSHSPESTSASSSSAATTETSGSSARRASASRATAWPSSSRSGPKSSPPST